MTHIAIPIKVARNLTRRLEKGVTKNQVFNWEGGGAYRMQGREMLPTLEAGCQASAARKQDVSAKLLVCPTSLQLGCIRGRYFNKQTADWLK